MASPGTFEPHSNIATLILSSFTPTSKNRSHHIGGGLNPPKGVHPITLENTKNKEMFLMVSPLL